ncbi:SGNH/GDSL hydrolase family protein [Companilactobacillus crustorum]|uniref:SGNH/GDSL hydrolase family protein n=1 Tax=Companilactobacillus crustorum TaxID=392416 RepID=UPI00096A6ED9|nr:SGNH/GDSL hydrolase family protein [Companilactobacillus crustorum]WDT65642.1 SGNH/GDSL hydrolase family protein [Companilactobacillus crustorum]HCD06838.1 SGNH/GDSL hydrolase family protein [Lactobacillus sp.]
MRRKYFLIPFFLLLMIILATACSSKKSTTKVDKTKVERKVVKSKSKTSNKKMTTLNDLKTLKKKTLTYYALGDSLSVGLFSNEMNSRFTTLFSNDLQKGTGKKVTEINTSSVGKTVTNFGLPNVQDLIDKQPDITTIEFGTNDAAYGVDAKNLGDFTTNLDTVVRRVKTETKAHILLMTTWSPSDGKYIANDATYDQVIKKIGQKYNVPVVNLSTIWQNNPQVTKNDLGYSQVYNRQKDTFHPNQLGHDKIAQLLYETVKNK